MAANVYRNAILAIQALVPAKAKKLVCKCPQCPCQLKAFEQLELSSCDDQLSTTVQQLFVTKTMQNQLIIIQKQAQNILAPYFVTEMHVTCLENVTMLHATSLLVLEMPWTL